MFFTYDIVRRVPAKRIEEEHRFSPTTISDWSQFCRQSMFVCLEDYSEKIDGPNKILEIDESKFGRRKYNRGHPVKGQWVFGGVERHSGRTFFFPVPGITSETLKAL
jgi:hypothetical protein